MRVRSCSSSDGERGELGRDPGGDGDHAVAGAELGGEHAVCAIGDVGAAVEDRFGRSLGDEEPHAAAVGEDRYTTAVVVEGGDGDPPELGCGAGGRAGCFPEGDVERVATHRGVSGASGLVAHESEREHFGILVAGWINRLREADVAIGEGPGLVGEQHVDVAEILDAHEPLDEHLLVGEPPRPDRQTGRYDSG